MYSNTHENNHPYYEYCCSSVIYHRHFYDSDCYEPCSVYPLRNNCAHAGLQSETVLIPQHVPRIYYRPISKRLSSVVKPKRNFWQQLFGDRKKCRCRPVCGACLVRDCFDCSPRFMSPHRPVCWCKYTTDEREFCPTSKPVASCQYDHGIEKDSRKCNSSKNDCLEAKRICRADENRKLKCQRNNSPESNSNNQTHEKPKFQIPRNINAESNSNSPTHEEQKFKIPRNNSPEAKRTSLKDEKCPVINTQKTSIDKQYNNNNVSPSYEKEERMIMELLSDTGISQQENKRSKRDSEAFTYKKDTFKEKLASKSRAVQTKSTITVDRGIQFDMKNQSKYKENMITPEKSMKSNDEAHNISSDGDICIGVTFTKEQIQYCKPQGGINCFSKSDESSGSGQVKLKVGCGSCDYSLQSIDNPESGRFNHKKSPLLLKRKNQEKGTPKYEQDYKMRSFPREHSQDLEERRLHRTVSEIIKKLHKIEDKLSVLEKEGTECDGSKLHLGGQKSSVSVYLKEPKNRNGSNGNNHSKNKKLTSKTTIIEIRHARSKSCSYEKNPPYITQRRSLSLGRFEEINGSKPKVIIKIAKPRNSHTHSNTRRYNYNNSVDTDTELKIL
ncbi:hypothetical protein J6590_029998 [Homalodisca vitripennis]|nr:hypothetical protein J6590_029998 [Homalodisca vitripennis]